MRAPWWEKAGPVPLQLGLATFGILALELALIRWTAGQVRAFAYFNNVVLIAAFLGLGLGLAAGRRRLGLVHATLPALAVVSAVLGLAEPLGLVHLSFPDASVSLWGAEMADASRRILNAGLFLALIGAIVAIFLFAGSAVGVLFARQPPLRAYRVDLAGSLLGVLAVTAVTATSAGPPLWLALGVVPFAWLSRRPLSIVAGIAAIAFGVVSVRGAVFSPYNRIDVRPMGSDLVLDVNRDFHQYMHDLSDRRLASATGADGERARRTRAAYDLPFTINPRRARALIVGAGTGNDVEAALRHGYGTVVSVDIDGRIIDLGRRLHPERPYDDRRVVPVVDDARAFFETWRGETFDAVVFGLLDSHAMFSALSSLRLDNYVYTEEAIRAAWRRVGPGGHLSISFSIFGGPWIAERLYWTITRATGREPVAFRQGVQYGVTFVVPRDDAILAFDAVPFPRAGPEQPASLVRTTSDDWPFLYVRPGVFPWGYVLMLGALLVLATVATPVVYGRRALAGGFDPVLFLMGAAFMLIETRGVTALSLLFGSTWIVNAAVFSGILAMALLANEVVARFQPRRLTPWFVALLVSVVLLWAVPLAVLNRLGLIERGLVGGLLNGLPVGFAGVIVSMHLARSPDAPAALGSNLLGSVLGGCLEYLSMALGLRALVVLALALYVGAFVLALRRARPAPRLASAARMARPAAASSG
jgi:SAM-dependent methyltransferase